MPTLHPLVNRLGRIKKVDYRDHLHRAVTTLPNMASRIKRWFPPPVLDQGDTPQCVAYSTLGYLSAGPVRNKSVTKADAQPLYDQCQLVDGFVGVHDGTSVRAAMQTLETRGYLSRYLWAYTTREAAAWVVKNGPMVFGTDWLESMFDTTLFRKSTFIDFNHNSPVAGGHAYLIFGVNYDKACPDGTVGAFEMQNSWGTSWGSSGRAWLSFSAADALLAEAGEAACASEILAKGKISFAATEPQQPKDLPDPDPDLDPDLDTDVVEDDDDDDTFDDDD